jgi:hypothetical protein
VSLTVALAPDSVFLWWTTTVSVITLGTWCYGAVEPE